MIRRVAALSGMVVLAAGSLVACGGKEEENAVPLPPEAAAGKRFASQNCLGCHSTDGAKRSGPTWAGIAGRQTTLTDGRVVVADDAYLTRAIVEPDAEIVAGYPRGVMSAAFPAKSVTPEQTRQLVAYLNTLK